jgi:hypothetical protein
MEIELKNVLENDFYIPKQVFTQEALDLFDIIKQKIYELHIEPNEVREYFRQFITNIQELGFIPPLIINLLRDVDNNYQTLVVSKNLTVEEERIIAACIKPQIIATNEIIHQTENKEVIIMPKQIVPIDDFTTPFSGISAEIYKTVINCTQGNEEFAQKFTKKAMTAFEKISKVPPISAMHSLPKISQAMFEQPRLQVNPTGILAYVKKQENVIQDSNIALPIRNEV